MKRHSERFPLVLDDEPVITPTREMDLYETSDLIMNIRNGSGLRTYTETVVHISSNLDVPVSSVEVKDLPQEIASSSAYVRSARENAKRDVRQKRQEFLVNERQFISRMSFKQDERQVKVPKNRTEEGTTGLTRAVEKLRQETYILAELPRSYQQPDNSSYDSKLKKNTYDFLKKSQVYNYPENQLRKERQIATELNLTRFE